MEITFGDAHKGTPHVLLLKVTVNEHLDLVGGRRILVQFSAAPESIDLYASPELMTPTR